MITSARRVALAAIFPAVIFPAAAQPPLACPMGPQVALSMDFKADCQPLPVSGKSVCQLKGAATPLWKAGPAGPDASLECSVVETEGARHGSCLITYPDGQWTYHAIVLEDGAAKGRWTYFSGSPACNAYAGGGEVETRWKGAAGRPVSASMTWTGSLKTVRSPHAAALCENMPFGC